MTKDRGLLRRLFGKNIPSPVLYAVVFVCVLAVGGLGFGAYQVAASALRTPPPPVPSTACLDRGATDVQHEGPSKECIGVTDGTFPFDPALTSIEKTIQTANAAVVREHPDNYVSVVMLLPISSVDGTVISITNDLEQLRGAYTAQNVANTSDVEGLTPYIQLLIGNAGYQANQQAGAVDIIKQEVGTEHVVAVDGLGVSLATTETAAADLGRAEIPVFGSTVTSDDFDDVPDMVRVAPDNTTEITVALEYIKTFNSAVLVEDQNPGDTYDSTLVTEFGAFQDATHQIVGLEPFDTSDRDKAQSVPAEQQAEADVVNRIAKMPADVCIAQGSGQPAVVLFAGRGNDLGQFVADLADRPCLNKPITIITGDDATDVPFTPKILAGLVSGVTLYYSGVANPGEWTSGGSTAAQIQNLAGFNRFDTAFTANFDAADLNDGNSMMAYDSVLTSVSAIRMTTQAQPTPSAVAGEIGALQGPHTVSGASGPIQFIAAFSTNKTASNPVGKPVPILKIDDKGQAQFVQLYWPKPKPAVVGGDQQ